MGKTSTRIQSSPAVIYLALLCLTILCLACSNSDKEPTVLVGQSRVKLIPYPYPAFTLLEHSTETFRKAEKILGGGGAVLALYSDANVWNNFRDGDTSDDYARTLMQGAKISTFENRVDQTTSLTQFNEYSKRAIPDFSANGDQILETNPRYFTLLHTYALDENAAFKSITTFILVQGKVLILDSFCITGSQFEEQLQSSALAWRDAYLKETKP